MSTRNEDGKLMMPDHVHEALLIRHSSRLFALSSIIGNRDTMQGLVGSRHRDSGGCLFPDANESAGASCETVRILSSSGLPRVVCRTLATFPNSYALRT